MGVLEPVHEYNTTDSQMKGRVKRDEQEDREVDPRMLETNQKQYARPEATNLSNNGCVPLIPVTKSNLEIMESSAEYVLPNHPIMNYQDLNSDTQEYTPLYMTPDMPQQQRNTVEVDGHQYQLPTSSSMESINIYEELEHGSTENSA